MRQTGFISVLRVFFLAIGFTLFVFGCAQISRSMNSPSAIGTATHKLVQGLQDSPLASLMAGAAPYTSTFPLTPEAHPSSVRPAVAQAKAPAGPSSSHKTELVDSQNYSRVPDEGEVERATAVPDSQGAPHNSSFASTKEAPQKHSAK